MCVVRVRWCVCVFHLADKSSSLTSNTEQESGSPVLLVAKEEGSMVGWDVRSKRELFKVHRLVNSRLQPNISCAAHTHRDAWPCVVEGDGGAQLLPRGRRRRLGRRPGWHHLPVGPADPDPRRDHPEVRSPTFALYTLLTSASLWLI